MKDGPGRPAENPIYRRTFVGREHELAQLKAAFDAAASGGGGLVTVVGEPGIGKTALCEQLATYAALRGGVALAGHCYEKGSLSLPYLAFVEAMRSYVLAREPEALRSELGAGAAEVARIVSEVRDKVQVELRPSSGPEDDRWRLYQGVMGFLKNAAQVQPLVIVLEDLHWADRGTLDLLLHVSRNLAGTRLLLVPTYRDVEVDRSHPLSGTLAELRRTGSFARVLLRGLTPDEVHRMVNAVTGQEAPWGLAEAVHRGTEGNPLFVQEVLRYLVEEGMLAREGGRWQRTGEEPLAQRIPEGLRDVIGKRLSRLSPECNRLLSIAAVIGRDFRLDTLEVVANLSEDRALEQLEEALKVGVLEEQARVGAVQYRFAHAFFRQTLYEELSAARRLRLHQQVARALEQQYASRLSEHAAELAEHFTQSTDRADLAKAVEYGEAAAQRAMGVYDYGEAARLLERALDVQEVLDPEDKAKRCDLLLALGEALMPAGEPQRVYEEVAEEAFEVAEALGDREGANRACRAALIGMNRYSAGNAAAAPAFRRWAERKNTYAESGTLDRVRADQAQASLLRGDGRLREGRTFQIRAIALARALGQPEAFFTASAAILGSDGAPQHEEERRRLAEEVLRWPRDGVNTYQLGATLGFSSSVLLRWGERERAEDIWRQIAALAERTRDASPELRALRYEGLTRCLAGEFERALEISARIVARGDEAGQPGAARIYSFLTAARPLLYLGRLPDLLAELDARARYGGSIVRDAWRALAQAQVGQREEAARAFEHLVAHVRTPEGEETPTDVLTRLLEVALELGAREVVAELATRLQVLSSVSIENYGTTCPARHLGAAAALLGEPEQARAYYEQALEVCAKIRFRPEIALTRLGLAELLLEQTAADVGAHSRAPGPGDAAALRKEALGHLDFAIAEFREMKMQPSLERALRHKELLRA